ncbi:MAG: hypothetical protein EXS13_08210 [Planctomycetes bacterium]|nr:hypothetical protein [Planctomycetota bacterium]
MKHFARWSAPIVALTLSVATLRAQEAPERAAEPSRGEAWDEELVAIVSRLPIQEQGRVKPLSSYARFMLMQLNGRGTFTLVDDKGTADGDDDTKSLFGPVEFLLDCVFFPTRAQSYRCFQLQTWEVLDAIGIERIVGRGKRDRYSYDELEAGREQLIKQAQAMRRDPIKSDAKNRTYLETQVFQLATKVNDFEGLMATLSFAMSDFVKAPESDAVRELLGGDGVRFSVLLEKGSDLTALQASAENDATRESIARLQNFAEVMANYSSHLTIWPPDAKPTPKVRTSLYNASPAEVSAGGSTIETWYSLADVHQRVGLGDKTLLALHLPAIEALEEAWAARPDQAQMKAALKRAVDSLVATATAREEYRKIDSEIGYVRADLFYWAQVLYVLCFVAIAIGWLLRGAEKYHRALPWVLTVPLALQIAAIVWRGYLRARPPVSNLYETIPFITAAAVLVCLVIEFIDRRRVAVVVAAALGAAGLFLTQRYEVKEAFERGNETMPQLQAVLDTNFWLSTHVTTVTIGYSAGLLAGVLGAIYILGRLCGLRRGDEAYYKSVAKMVYGVICFGLLFSVVGTILGGVWANDSWGRFWGWDPKENGALMICLWEIALLHGRMGGYLRDLGICAAAVFGANIVVFSWWGVNQLGVGLHAYGETDGVDFWLWTTYGVMTLITLAGIWLASEARAARKDSSATPTAPTA